MKYVLSTLTALSFIALLIGCERGEQPPEDYQNFSTQAIECQPDTIIKIDTVILTDMKSGFDPNACGDDKKIYRHRCTSELVRHILAHCKRNDMHWVGYESQEDGRTTSLFCDAFKNADGKKHK